MKLPTGSPEGWVRDAWRGLAAGCRRMLLPARREADAFLWNLRMANRVLWVALAGLSVYVAIDLMVSKPTPTLTFADRVGAGIAAVSPVEVNNPLKPLSEYLDGLSQRSPFTGVIKAAAPVPIKKTARDLLKERASGLVVVGIDRGANPVALIEDQDAEHTYVVKVGEEIKGMVVKSIDASGVLITYEGQELTIR